jgi:hypothetical protein
VRGLVSINSVLSLPDDDEAALGVLKDKLQGIVR